MSSLLLLDLSGSVLRSGSFGALEDAAKSYAHTVLQGADDGEQLAVMTFDGRASPQLVVPFTNDEAAVQRGLASLEVRECTVSADCSGTADRRSCAGWRCVDDSTNLYGAVMASLDALDTELIADPSIPWKDAALVVFTDGSDQAGRVSATVALSRAAAAKPRVFTVGLGGEVDQAVLQRLGRDGYFPASKASDLDAAFTAVAGRVTAQANRFYVLEYCSPKRSGLHTLKVTATAPTPQGPPLRGGLSADFDATGFESGCVVQ